MKVFRESLDSSFKMLSDEEILKLWKDEKYNTVTILIITNKYNGKINCLGFQAVIRESAHFDLPCYMRRT